ncbi:MAG TPA: alpha-glucan family phosphorylase, partial [Bacteroidetes bacterium]|nr:alpha-glucan family phosphorylase [Bacteroidota bacterium]HEX05535.1 alpha-glucan family phosphorylase [Bacteroidota bacterium]
RVTVERASDALDMETFTIGFARRFATYKRANLLFLDQERLLRLLTDPDRPVQLILAGKAHPKDEPGKNIIREIIHVARDAGVRDKIVFLENYDINVARHMVQGTDIWLNTPRVPMEASGTSGMKAVLNGTLHVSTFDGWWAEGYSPEIGWTIGHGEMYDEPEEQDQIESELLFDLLEKEIVPTFYDRPQGRVPRNWTDMMKSSLLRNCPFFNTNRMVREYTERAYLPNHRQWRKMVADDYAPAKKLSEWKEKVRQGWGGVRATNVQLESPEQLTVGGQVQVHSSVYLGKLKPDDVQVEIYMSRDIDDTLHQGYHPILMEAGDKQDDGSYHYHGSLDCHRSGAYSLSVRVLPRHELLRSPHDLQLISWEE